MISYRPAGQVLAVPASAVVDAGLRKVVFVESMPGMFDGVEVVLGARCGDLYPVVRGLEAGQRVAIAGAFLLDAETRLNPSLAAGYFGAGRGERAAAPGPLASATKTGDSADRGQVCGARARGSPAGRAPEAMPRDQQAAGLDGHAGPRRRLWPGRLPVLRRL